MSVSDTLPRGYRMAAVHGGIKQQPGAPDLTLVVSDRPAAAAGVFTQNRVVAAPVRLSRDRVPSGGVRAIVANSGNANACTGPQGLSDAAQMAEWVAGRVGCPATAVLVCSTGIIGRRLPMERVKRGIAAAWEQLSDGPAALEQAARGIMTTDTVPKFATCTLPLDGQPVHLAGLAKGAAMIAPNMATMLCFLITDAAVAPGPFQRMLQVAVQGSFNRISVEGHTSTNDTVLALANGAAGGGELSGTAAEQFAAALSRLCQQLAWAIVRDAEGARHFVTVDVEGLGSDAEAERVARAVANSPLVKTAICGGDPNWGRIVSAAGYAGVEFDERELSLWISDVLVYERGQPVAFDDRALSELMKSRPELHLLVRFSGGSGRCRFWTCDLTEQYVRLNAEYHT